MNRRAFLQSGTGALLGCSELAFLAGLRPVSAAQVRVDPGIVRFDPAIEPLVRLLEDTPRARVLEEIGARIRKGLTYREILAALLLAGIRNVQPRPAVGFKFHAVMVVHSAHLVAQSSPDADRWLPLVWAIDHFKESQADDAREGDWTMGPVEPKSVPAKAQVIRAFTRAMDNWDESAADAAAAGLARHVAPEEAFEIFARYAVRDMRSIGHKAIYVANAWRTLDTIGWQHSEPVLRSLAYALLAREGSDPLRGNDRVDRPWPRNRGLAGKLRADWQKGNVDAGATGELLAVLREGTEEETADRMVSLIQRGISPQSVWDALMCGAGEVLMRSPGIVPLHAVTTTNAIRYMSERSRSDDTRRMLLLQNGSFLPFLRSSRGSNARVDQLAPIELSASGDLAVSEIFATIGRDKQLAARQVLGYLARNPSPKLLLDTANRFVFLKGNDAHDYKFGAAALEDFNHLSPSWRARYLAASVFWLSGSGAPDSDVVQRARRALAG
jgi:hypothetical protein